MSLNQKLPWMKKSKIFLLCFVSLYCNAWTGGYLKDYTTEPVFSSDKMETVADLNYPPGNIAVSSKGRVFITFHPEGNPEIKVAELSDGKASPFPDREFQSKRKDAPFFDTVLSLRIDSKDRLWTLDFGGFGFGKPRLLAFDINTGAVVHDYIFPSEISELGSMLNDFQISPDAEQIYIADASFFRRNYGIIIYDIKNRISRKVLVNHESVKPENYIAVVDGMRQTFFGILANQPGVDSIALDKKGQWLYYSAVTSEKLYRIHTSHLLNASIPAKELENKVEVFAMKSMSDGLTMDLSENIYISDMEHGAVNLLSPDKKLKTLLKDPVKIRWPDGFSFGPDGWLYFTCSSLQYVILKSRNSVQEKSPYQVYRFKPGHKGMPGQ